MSQKEELIRYLEAMLSDSNDTRNNAEAQLLQASAVDPNAFVGLVLSTLKDSAVAAKHRTVAVVLLKKILVSFPESQVKGYLKLDEGSREQFRREILILLSQQTEDGVRDQLADLIADVAGSVIQNSALAPQQQWPSLVEHLFELYGLNQPKLQATVMRILGGLFSYIAPSLAQYSDKFYQLFVHSLQGEDLGLKVDTVEALATLVQQLKPSQLKVYKPLVKQVLGLMTTLVGQKDEERLTSVTSFVCDMCESEPSFLKQSFDELAAIMQHVRGATTDSESSLKSESVEALVFILERFHGLAKEKPKRVLDTLELIFQNMMEIEDDVNPEWSSPPDGFNDDMQEDDDQKLIKVSLDHIDRLVSSFGSEFMLPVVSGCVQGMLGPDKSWKMQHAAIMAMSQVGEYMFEHMNEVRGILNILLSFTSHPNPRVRYACMHCAGQFAEDLNPEFEEQFSDLFYQIVIPRTQDPNPRVLSHSMAALINFLENCQRPQVEKYFDTIYQRIVYNLEHGICYVKEICLSTLSALCEGSEDLFLPHYDQSIKLLFSVLACGAKPEFKQLKGNAIECVTIIAKVAGKERMMPYAPQIIHEMINIQNTDISPDGHDPQKSYLLGGWQRICSVMGEAFTPYVDSIMPRLLQIACSSIQNVREQVKSYEVEELDAAVQTMSTLLEFVGAGLIKYMQSIYQLLCQVIDRETNEDTKLMAIACFSQLVKLVKGQNMEYSNFTKHIVERLWKIMDDETNPTTLQEYTYELQRVLKYAGPVFSAEEISTIYGKCISLLKDSQKRKQSAYENYDLEEEDKNDVEQMVASEKKAEEELVLDIANIIGMIFRTHQERSLPLFQQAYATLVQPALTQPDPNYKLFGLFIIDDAIEHLGKFLSPELLAQFLGLFYQLATQDNLDIRLSSVFGIGIAAQCLQDKFAPQFEESVKCLSQAIEQKPPEEEEQKRTYRCVRDNCVSSLGKILQAMWHHLPQDRLAIYVAYWYKHFPLRDDPKEGHLQHQLLAQIVVQSPGLIFAGDNLQSMRCFVEVAKHVCGKGRDKAGMLKAAYKQILQKFSTTDPWKQMLENCGLEDNDKEFLVKLISS